MKSTHSRRLRALSSILAILEMLQPRDLSLLIHVDFMVSQPNCYLDSLGAQESGDRASEGGSWRERAMDILKEFFGTIASDKLQTCKGLFESDVSSTPPVELGLGERAREEHRPHPHVVFA